MGNYYFLLIDMYLIISAMTQCLCPRDCMGAEGKDVSQRGEPKTVFPQICLYICRWLGTFLLGYASFAELKFTIGKT